MESSEVSKIIEDEVAGDWSASNAHGVSLRRCLVPPVRKTFEDVAEGRAVELWLVLEEVPEDGSGYKIVFDEESGMFGLAVKGAGGRDIFIGFHGTFMETLAGM